MDIIDCDNLVIEENEFSSGSFSKVYKGCYFGNPVCVKVIKKEAVIDKEMLKFIDSEINILRDLLYQPHKNIIKFIGIGEKESLLFLVTELINGGDLGTALMNKSIPMSWNLRIKIARDIAEGMAHLHSKNIMHRDLKSNNLLVGKHWNIKICDFGFAKELQNPLTNTICGSENFMGPEVILGIKYGIAADIYSYGMVLIELITRQDIEERLPQNSFDLDYEELEKKIPKDCPRDFYELVLKCTSYYAKDRPTFKEIIVMLDDIIENIKQQQLALGGMNSPRVVPELIPDPKFDESSIDQWFMLSLLPEDCLDNPTSTTSLEDRDENVNSGNSGVESTNSCKKSNDSIQSYSSDTNSIGSFESISAEKINSNNNGNNTNNKEISDNLSNSTSTNSIKSNSSTSSSSSSSSTKSKKRLSWYKTCSIN
ncbi:LISK family protein kinase [Tieghemostelium lacteum]|uniref:non-specific serine/threonine protein kinase n=1 Tax=Tieghemostelium lacteum TaxID=361077 RepID=A0A151ZDV0_TIELA|nr:LISK family protein kinase [Tieghemostelium lacteum]|eukprot:KYQ92133.1 LISK family protein kinase [Tieghemostelium lacteum]